VWKQKIIGDSVYILGDTIVFKQTTYGAGKFYFSPQGNNFWINKQLNATSLSGDIYNYNSYTLTLTYNWGTNQRIPFTITNYDSGDTALCLDSLLGI